MASVSLAKRLMATTGSHDWRRDPGEVARRIWSCVARLQRGAAVGARLRILQYLKAEYREAPRAESPIPLIRMEPDRRLRCRMIPGTPTGTPSSPKLAEAQDPSREQPTLEPSSSTQLRLPHGHSAYMLLANF